MIVFYNLSEVKEKKVVEFCTTSCAANCLKPKSKCCHKYKKKGINCKRCPKLFEASPLKQVS